MQGRPVSLPAREFELAALLFRNPGRILTKDALCQHIWGTVDRKYDASLATYISNLRSALGLRSRNGYVVPRSTTTDTAWSAWPDFSGMVGYGAVEFSGFASQRHGACALP